MRHRMSQLTYFSKLLLLCTLPFALSLGCTRAVQMRSNIEPFNSAMACRNQLTHPKKRRRCVRCTRRGGVYLKDTLKRYGVCRLSGLEMLRTPDTCQRKIELPKKRARCILCTKRGGVFLPEARRGVGGCQ